MSRTGTAIFSLMVLLLGACGTRPSGVSIAGAWELQAGTLDGRPITMVQGYPITLTFEDGRYSGTAACNGYGGEFTTRDGTIALTGMSITEMACPEGQVMTSESEFIDAMGRVREFAVKDGLRLKGKEVDLTFVALPPVPTQDLLGTVWVLKTLIDGEVASSVGGERATLELFTDGSMLGSTGCRTLHGEYRVSGARVAVVSLTAEGYCSTEMAAQDNHVVSVLSGGFRVAIEGVTLTLSSAGDQGLVYRSGS